MKNNIKINTKAFKLNDQIFFAQRLSLLLNSGISIVESLSIMKNMDSSSKRKNIYEHIITHIEHGVSLSKSIKTLGLSFNSLLVSLIQNGENGGHLSDALVQAHIFLEKKNDMRNKMISSLIYPAFIVIATLSMTLFLILYIFPKIIPLLTSLNIQLPLITRIVQGFYYFIISYGVFSFFITVSVLGIAVIAVKKNKKAEYFFHKLIISIPILKVYIKIYLLSSVCRMGEMLLSSGRGIPDMLAFSKESIKNTVYKKVFHDISLESMRGISFSLALEKHKILFPQLLINLCALGERTGNLALMLGHCSKIFEQDMDNVLKRFSSLIEPVLMVFMGLIVGSVALSIILPVYEITNHLSR